MSAIDVFLEHAEGFSLLAAGIVAVAIVQNGVCKILAVLTLILAVMINIIIIQEQHEHKPLRDSVRVVKVRTDEERKQQQRRIADRLAKDAESEQDIEATEQPEQDAPKSERKYEIYLGNLKLGECIPSKLNNDKYSYRKYIDKTSMNEIVSLGVECTE